MSDLGIVGLEAGKLRFNDEALIQLRIATQVRELAVQGITLSNTLKAMETVWDELKTEDGTELIVQQTASKVKYQLVQMYAAKLMKYMNSIIGMDLVPLAYQEIQSRTWRQDSIILNIASNRIDNHEHLFVLLMVNLFGLDKDVVSYSLYPTFDKLRAYVRKVYDFDLGETDHLSEDDVPTIEGATKALREFICAGIKPTYKLY